MRYSLETTTQHALNKKDTSVFTSSQSLDLNTFTQLIKEVRLTVHKTIDPVIPINLSALDSLIKINMTRNGLNATVYYSEIVNLNTDTVVKSSMHSNSFGIKVTLFL